MPKIYVYTRVSTIEQSQALDQQDRQAMTEAQVVKMRHPEAELVEPIFREQRSAFKRAFHQRPIGSILCQLLQPGDHIVFARLDRYVRLGKDFELRTEEWLSRGITLHFADLQVDMSTAAGSLMARMFAAIAQYYSQSLSERMRLSYQERYMQGVGFTGGLRGLLRHIKRPGYPEVIVADRKSIVYLRYALWRRRSSFLKNGVADSWKRVADDLERARVAHGDIPKYRTAFARGMNWSEYHIYTLMKTVITSKVPALNTERLTKVFREGLSPFSLRRNGERKRLDRTPCRRDSVYKHYQELAEKKGWSTERPPKRWATRHDQCVSCHRTDYKHFSNGLCRPCYNKALSEQRSQQCVTT